MYLLAFLAFMIWECTKNRFNFFHRCYNCGEFANHIAAKCTLGPQPKRCHHCKSVDHLIADCPSRSEKKNNKEKSTNNNNNDDCCCDNNKDLRHTVHLGKVLLVKEEDDDEDDEDVQLHDHRINCSSSPASSCSSPLGKRELVWFLSLMNILKTLQRARLYTNRWVKITKNTFKEVNKDVWFNQLHFDNIIWHEIFYRCGKENFKMKFDFSKLKLTFMV